MLKWALEDLKKKVEQEKIVMPVNQRNEGWNEAIDYIISEYLSNGLTLSSHAHWPPKEDVKIVVATRK